MGIVFDEQPGSRADAPEPLHPPLAQLLAVTSSNTADVMERLLLAAQTGGELAAEELTGSEYLLFTCGGAACGIRLAALREILPTLPQVVALPASPEWMLGVFAMRTEILALIDPTPVLLDGPNALASASHPQAQSDAERLPEAVLVVGAGERCLAWAISAVGDIVRLDDHDIVPDAHPSMIISNKVRERFIAGYYVSPLDGRCHTIVQAGLVMDDVLRALQEVPNG